ncbi:beta-1,3-galactosyltransferase 1-like isoform X2 [Dermacentor albipictus]|uniref:beta-1,3-galactosyltransferase 1-like isoform X2 n=1 Tax=Dermacentor albipictus TaxID=60249 RepID=UPI0031FDA6AA
MVRLRYATKSCFGLVLSLAAFAAFVQFPDLLRSTYRLYLEHANGHSVTETLVGAPVFRSKQQPSLRTLVAPGAAYAPRSRRPAASEAADAMNKKIDVQKRGAKPSTFRLIAQKAEQNRRGAVLLEESLRRLDRVAAASKRSKKASRPKPTWLPPYDPSKYRFMLDPELCSGNGSVHFLVLVQSAVKNFERRALVRDTWGSVCRRNDSAAGGTALCRLGFVLGTSPDPVLEYRLRDEASRHGDLVQSNFMDSYYNLSLSTVTGLRWAQENCKRYAYLVKADDDAFVNLAALREYLAAGSRRRRRAIIGYLMKGFRPNRNRASKWFTSPQLFAKARLPDFVSGFAYAVTHDAVGPLYAAARMTHMFPFEDVYVTGMCRERAPVAAGSDAIALEGAARFKNHRKKNRGGTAAKTLCSLYGNVLAQHELTAAETRNLWGDLTAGKCS